MITNEGLVRLSVDGIYEYSFVEADLIILGKSAYASYIFDNDGIDNFINDFGSYDMDALNINLGIYIESIEQIEKYHSKHDDSNIYDVLNEYRVKHSDSIDFEFYCNSNVWQERALVAMNGMYLEKLSKDPHAGVRQKVVEYLLSTYENGNSFNGCIDFACTDDEQEELMFEYFTPLIMNIGDIGYVDSMLTDEDRGVRYTIAKLGITKHLNVLVDDKDEYVRMAVTKKGLVEHLEKLLNDKSNEVRRLIVCNQNVTLEQLETIAHSTKNIGVIAELMNKGIFYKSFIEGKTPSMHYIKILVAGKGYCHDILSQDTDALIRETVAGHTNDVDILRKLTKDEDEDVRGIALRRIGN